MGLSTVLSRAQLGIEAPLISIETHLGPGLPCFSMVGLPETVVREARDRVKSALQNSGFKFPRSRVTVNLAPAELPKEGGRFDLGIALGILIASRQLPLRTLERFEILGELGLGGDIRRVRGALSAAIAAREHGHGLIVPQEDCLEARLIHDLDVVPARNLKELADWLKQPREDNPATGAPKTETAEQSEVARLVAKTHESIEAVPEQDLIRGQEAAKRALMVAAAGGHHVLMKGPPGSGKTMLARYLALLLPPPTQAEALSSIQIHSAAGYADAAMLLRRRPLREPHHSASSAAMVGGGRPIRPGEISLAHNGLLFLDELPEFNRQVLENLREPLESGEIVVSRVGQRLRFPARFQLVAAMNPCPVGRSCTPLNCLCSEAQLRRYRARLSAPLLDRIDMHVLVPALPHSVLLQQSGSATQSLTAYRKWADDQRRDVQTAVHRQWEQRGKLNRDLDSGELALYCGLAKTEHRLLLQAADRFELSARGCHRVLRVARTIADLAGEARIGTSHLTEALSYRAASTM